MVGHHRREITLANVAELERTDTTQEKSSFNEFFAKLSRDSDKHTRARTKLEVLIILRGLRGAKKQAAIDEVISSLFGSEDACLQNYLADILLDLADPYGDASLIEAFDNYRLSTDLLCQGVYQRQTRQER